MCVSPFKRLSLVLFVNCQESNTMSSMRRMMRSWRMDELEKDDPIHSSTPSISDQKSARQNEMNDIQACLSCANKWVCHSGGAMGADRYFENVCTATGMNIINYMPKGVNSNKHSTRFVQRVNAMSAASYHALKRVVEFMGEYEDGDEEKKNAPFRQRPRWMGCYPRRNHSQVKDSEMVIAFTNVSRQKRGTNVYTYASGGTRYGIFMGILKGIPVYVFDSSKRKWFTWDTDKGGFKHVLYTKMKSVILPPNFTGIGSRECPSWCQYIIKTLILNTLDYHGVGVMNYSEGVDITSRKAWTGAGDLFQPVDVKIRKRRRYTPSQKNAPDEDSKEHKEAPRPKKKKAKR